MLSLVFIFVFYLVLPSYLCFVYHHFIKKKKKKGNVVKYDVAKNAVYNELVKKVNTTDTSRFFQKRDCDSKISEIKGKNPSITGSVLLLVLLLFLIALRLQR